MYFFLLLCGLYAESRNIVNKNEYVNDIESLDEIEKNSADFKRPPRIGREFENSINKLEREINDYEEAQTMKIQSLKRNVSDLKKMLTNNEKKRKDKVVKDDAVLCDPSLDNKSGKDCKNLFSALENLLRQLLNKT